MRLLELFSGTGSVGAAFRRAGWDVVSVDLDPDAVPDICADVLDLDYHALWRPGDFDAVHASPPCTQYSRARTTARTPRDLEGADAIVKRTLEIIFHLRPTCFIVENPYTGMMKDRPVMHFMTPLMRVVTYCTYGLPYKKQTAIWSNLLLWRPRRACSKLFPCEHLCFGRHPATAQRGPGRSVNGYLENDRFGLNDLYRIPAELCDEWADAATRQVQARAAAA